MSTLVHTEAKCAHAKPADGDEDKCLRTVLMFIVLRPADHVKMYSSVLCSSYVAKGLHSMSLLNFPDHTVN